MLNPDTWVARTASEYASGFNDLLPTGGAWPRESGTVLQDVILGLAGIWGTEVDALAALLLTVESDPRQANILLSDWEKAFGLPDVCIPIPTVNTAARQANLVAKMTMLGAQSREFFIAQAANIGLTVTIREYSPYMCGVSRCGGTSIDNVDASTPFTAVTNAATATSSKIISFASINSKISVGQFAYDQTTGTLIGIVDLINNAKNTISLKTNALNPISSGDTLKFYGRMRWQLGGPQTRFYWVVKVTGFLSNWNGADVAGLFNRWKPAHTKALYDFSLFQGLNESLTWNTGYIALL